MRHKTWTLKWMLALALCCTLATSIHAQSQAQAGDEYQLQKRSDTTQVASVQVQQKIIVWTNDDTHRKGRVTLVRPDTLGLDSIVIPLASVVKIKAYSKELGTQRMNSWARISAWVALGALGLILLGLVLLAGGVAASAIMLSLGAIVLVASAVFFLGTILALMGANVPSTYFKLRNGWRIKFIPKKIPK